MKQCCRCKEWKPLDDFNRMRSASDGCQARCRVCQRVLQAVYRETHLEELNRKGVIYQNANPDRRRNNHVKNRYGITLDEIDRRLQEQGGCALCGSETPRGRGWSVDHDHACCPNEKTCGRCIRGILCAPCNSMIGFGNDDATILHAGADYLIAYAKSVKH